MIKNYLLCFLLVTLSLTSFSQSEDCSGAPLITNGNCYSSSPGLSQSFSGCVGNADDDVWYRFVAAATSHSITVSGSATYDPVFQVYSGACGGLVSLSCIDNTFTGQTESTVLSGLTVGNTYYVRIYHYFSGSGAGTFTLCLNNPPSAPANNNCTGATSLTVNSSCINTVGTSFGATLSQVGCSGNANDDVWYTFTANNYTQTIQVTGSATFDAVVELFTGACGSLVSSICMDNTFSGGTEVITASGLTPGNTYRFRVYDYYSGAGSSFSVCVSGNSIITGTQPNDEPCGAIDVPAVTSDCNNMIFSNVGATPSASPSGPTAICENYNNSTNTYGAASAGGFNASTSKDVWFRITVPASGNIYITPIPNMSTGWVQDGVMALYRGVSCGALTTFTCSDDYNYPAGYNDLQPFLRATGLTPGEVVYLRYWGWGSEEGNFGFCVTSPTNDNCANALYICDINGFSATTSPAYTRDHPCNMRGNGETSTYTYSVNANPAGPFGAGGAWGTGSTFNDVYIDNNSWIRFTAASPTVSLRVTVDNCWGSGANSNTTSPGTPRGVQMQIFSTTSACCGFTPVSDYKENAAGSFTATGVSTFTVNANSLTVGQDYYVMVDGWSGDICNYNIQAIAGVALPGITASPDSICPGQSSILTAPLGATGYTWEPTGPPSVNTRTLSVSPGTTMTYTCYVGGVCGYKQTLTKTIFVKTVPTVQINSGNPISNCGTQATALTGSGANTYTWNTGPTTTSVSVSPTTTTTYSVIGRASNGCTNTAVSTITVNPIPTFTITSSNTNTICSGQSTTLSVSGTATNYTWSPGGATTNSIVVSPSSTTVYNVTGRNTEGCTAVIPTTITVNALPTVSSSSVTICSGNSGTLTASGASSYSWTTGSTLATTVASPTTTTNYTVIGTAANSCTNSAVGRITVNNLPTVTINSNNPVTICNGQTVTLSGGGAVTYTWNTGATTNNINVSPTANTSYTVTGTAATGCSNTAVTTVTVNALPSLSVTGTNTICAGQSTTLAASGASTYNWMPGSVNNSTISVSPAGTTVYTVTGTAANTCSNSIQHTVTVNALPTISVNNATVCNGSSVILTGSGSSTSYSWSTGANTNTVSVSPATLTNYTVTGTAVNTCTNSAIAQVSVIALPSITVASQTICLNQSVNLTASGANTYTWSNTQNGNSISVSPTVTTSYSVVGTAISSCTNSANATVTVLSLPQLTSTPSIAPSNCAASTGSITNVTITGSPVLTYTWTNSSSTNVGTSPTLNNQPAGTYNLLVRDGNGCFNNFGPYSVTNPGSPAAPSASATANSICVGQTINLFANGSGGTYTWSGPNSFTTTTQNPTITNATVPMSGVYSVFETLLGCSGPAANVSVTVNALPTPNAALSQTLICEGTTLGLSGSSATSYTWSGPSSFNSNIQNPSIPNVTTGVAGVYTLAVTNANNCVGTTTVSVNISTNPTPTVSSNPSFICAGETVTLSASGGIGYSWSGPNSFANTTPNPTINNAGTAANGNYTVVVTGANTCTASAITSVTVIALPTFTSAVNNANICYGATIQFNAGTAVNTYSWTGPNAFSANNNASPSINNASPLNTGIYTVTAGGGSCVSTQTIAVNVYSEILLTPTAVSTVICEDGTIQLQGNGGVSFQWNGPNSFASISQNPSITNAGVNASGIYTLAVLDANNCPGSNTVAILVNPNPTVNASATSTIVCVGDNISLTASGGTSYTWLGPNGFNDATQSPVINNSGTPNSGQYTVTATDANACSAVATVSVSVASLPTFTVSANATNVCFGAPIQLNAGSGTYVYNWTGPDSFTANNNANPQLINTTPNNSGTYTVTAVLGSCSASETIAINVYPQINVNASANSQVICNGSTVNLLGIGGGNYAWSGPDNFSSTNQNPQITNAQSIASGIYTLTVTDNTTNCSASDTVTILISPAPSFVNSSSDSTCVGGVLTLYADFGPNATVNWYSDAALTNLVQANANTYQPNLTSNGTYTFYVQGVVGNCVSSVQMVTGFYYNIVAIASSDVYSGYAPLTVNLTGSNSQGVTNTDNFSWNFGDNTTSTLPNPSHVFTSEGTYTVVLLVTDVESGCLDTASVTIKVEDDVIVVVPNVFTPNGDGANDGFKIKIRGASTAEGFIYNRWGQLLYSWDALNISWDGKAANGENCPDATYYYLIKVVDKKNKEHLFPGYVLIIR